MVSSMNRIQLLSFLGLFLFALCLSSCMSGSKQGVEALVETGSGSVQGYVEDGVFTFEGIPYAKAERFMPPQVPEAWEGIKECTLFSPIAMQVNSWSPDSVMDEHKLFTVN